MTNPGSPYPELRIKSWEELRNAFDRFGYLWVFRGQTQAEWGLRTTLERAFDEPDANLRNFEPIIENQSLDVFKLYLHHYLSTSESPRNDFEALALLQHFGGPTRLLDFTESPYVATYFAVRDARSDSVVWAVNRFTLQSHFVNDVFIPQYNEGESIHVDKVGSLVGTKFREIFYQNRHECVWWMNSGRPHARERAQQALYLVPGRIDRTFDTNLRASLTEVSEAQILKIVIPRKLHYDIMTDLRRMAIFPSSLFPGLEGHARGVNDWIKYHYRFGLEVLDNTDQNRRTH